MGPEEVEALEVGGIDPPCDQGRLLDTSDTGKVLLFDVDSQPDTTPD